ncbi:hypothetical protein C8R46DRAFT_981017 [Mycena filopes]|nr:hypothetical protein C8R46DRAFT_981017 [Mycena filopes]
MMTSLSPFDLVSQNLLTLGALSIHDFLSAPHEHNFSPIHVSAPPLSLVSQPQTVSADNSTEAPPTTGKDINLANLARLHATCMQQFPQNSDILRFDFLEETIGEKQCILTITRPDGSTRSYKTEPVFRRRNEAKAHVATIAIEYGAIDFIVRGDSDELKAKKGVLLASLNEPQPVASTSKLTSAPPEEAETAPSMLHVEAIEGCCREWRGPLLKPYWYHFDDGSKLDAKQSSKSWKQHGAVLKIQLTPHCYRVYSCAPIFDSFTQAQESCANIAIDENVLEFIRHGNGQTAPLQSGHIFTSSKQSEQQTLQTFYESLPRPLEEDFGEKTAAEINATGTLGNLLTLARGSHLTCEYYHLELIHENTLVHGYLLRMMRPGECRSYVVEPRFANPKRAKSAIALLALSLGVGKWIREIAAAVKARITPEMRHFVLTTVTPTLTAETRRIGGSGSMPRYEFYTEGDGIGCKLQVALGPNGEDPREYVAPADYSSKADAKVAASYLAAQQGVIDLMRGSGRSARGLPPNPHTGLHPAPAFTFQHALPQAAPQEPPKKKRMRRKKKEGPPAKRPRTDGGPSALVSLPQKPVVDAAAARGHNTGEPPTTRRSVSLEDGELDEW